MTLSYNAKTFLLTALVATLILGACNNNKQQQEDLQAAVIAKHDSVMAEMSTLMEKKIKIENILNRLDTIKKESPALDTAMLRLDLTKIKANLSAADEGMMTWMHNFNPDFSKKSDEEILNYLKEQQSKINAVDKSIKAVLLSSDSVLTIYK